MYFLDTTSSRIYLNDEISQKISLGNPSNILAICRYEIQDKTYFYIIIRNCIYLVDCVQKTKTVFFTNSDSNRFLRYLGMAAIVFKGNLCLIGGTNKDKAKSGNERVFQMCSVNDPTWRLGEKLNIARSHSSVCTVGDSIYICGGWGSALLNSIEKYENCVWVCLSFRVNTVIKCSMIQVSPTRVLLVGCGQQNVYMVQEICLTKNSVKVLESNLPIAETENFNFLYNEGILSVFDLNKSVKMFGIGKTEWSDIEALFIIREALNFKII